MQLKNGMKVLFVESHKSPVVSVQMWVKTGSADEGPSERGISHFIEHLVFKGTEKYKVGEIAKIVEMSGGELNAYTSFDQTVFYVTISKEFLETGLDVISQMMGHPKFDSDEIDNEREVVIEEIKRGLDNPHRQASQLLFKTMYKEHPYKYPVIGYEKIIKKVKRKTLVDYYHRRYVPENMTLVIAGDFKSSEIKSQVKEYYESFENFKLKKVKRKREEKQEKPRVKVEKSDFMENIAYISWPAPRATHKDIPALDVLSVILGSGASSRLVNRLRVENPLVNYIGSSAYTPLNQGFFAVTFSATNENLVPAFEEIKQEVLKLIEAGITNEELIKAKINFESDEYYSLETVDGLAKKVGYYNFLFDDHKYFKEYLRQVNALTVDDILKVAKKYLKPNKINVVLSSSDDPEPLKKQIKKWCKEFDKEFSLLKTKKDKVKKASKPKKLLWSKSDASSGEPKIKTLNSGSKVILIPSKDSTVLSIKSASLSGMRAESIDRLGTAELLSRVWGAGTKTLTERQIHEITDESASSLAAYSGRNTIGLSLTTLVPFTDKMLDLYFDVLLSPVFDKEVMNREKFMMIEHINKRDDNPAQKCVLQFMQSLFGEHPYSLDPFGTKETIEKISEQDLQNFKERYITRENSCYVVAGQFQEKKILSKLEEATSRLSSGKQFNKSFEFNPPQHSVKKVTDLQKEQTHIILGYPGLTFLDKRRYALQIIQAILAGQGGRLFLELRDKNSLAYSVSPLKMEGIDAGYFGAYIGCSPEKTNKAIKMMKEEFNKLISTPVTDAELDGAKRYLIGRHDIGLQKTTAIANNALFDTIYGVDLSETYNYSNIINAITADQIQAVAKDIFQQPETISIVGPKA